VGDVGELMRARTSARWPFDMGRPVSAEDLDAVLEAARWAPTAHNMQNFEIVVVDDPGLLGKIAAIRRPPSEEFIRENYAQLSFSEEELARKKTGILGTMFPPSWRDPDFRLANFTDEEIAEMQRPMPPAPALLVVTYDPARRAPASEGDFLGHVSLGCAMQNMWLAAEERGMGMHIVSSLANAPEVRELLHIPDELEVVFAIRLGYPAHSAQVRPRVRRDIQDFAFRNRYGASI
jgi:nitroreductase